MSTPVVGRDHRKQVLFGQSTLKRRLQLVRDGALFVYSTLSLASSPHPAGGIVESTIGAGVQRQINPAPFAATDRRRHE